MSNFTIELRVRDPSLEILGELYEGMLHSKSY